MNVPILVAATLLATPSPVNSDDPDAIALSGERPILHFATLDGTGFRQHLANLDQQASVSIPALPDVVEGDYGTELPASGGLRGHRLPVQSPDRPAESRFGAGGGIESSQTPPPTVSWKADLGNKGGYPSDANIAASRTHIVITNRQKIAFFDKSGANLGSASSGGFFAPLGLDTKFQVKRHNDLRVIYDGYRDRFWVCAVSRPFEDDLPREEWRTFIVAAVSRTENPLDGWYYYYWDAAAEYGQDDSDVWEPGFGPDYPSLGIGPKCIYQSHHAVPTIAGSSYKSYWMVNFFDADELAKGNPAGGWSFWHLTNPDGSDARLLQPTVHHGSTGRAYLVSRGATTHEAVIWGITDPLGPHQRLEHVAIELSRWQSPVDSPQLGSSKVIKMTNLGTNVLKSVYQNGLLYFVTNDAREWFDQGEPLSSIRLVRLFILPFPNIDLGSPAFIDRTFGGNNLLDDPEDARMYYGWPAIEVNDDGDMAIVYSRSGKEIYPQVRASVYYDSGTDILPSRLIKAGEKPYEINGKNSANWGDLAGASLDPFDDEGIWLAQQYANGGPGGYDIWVAKMFGRARVDWILARAWYLQRKVAAGKDFRASITVRNQGDGPAAAPILVQIESLAPDGSVIHLGQYTQPPLAPGENQTTLLTLRMPRGVVEGDHRLIVTLTSGRDEQYSRENDRLVSEKTIRVLSAR